MWVCVKIGDPLNNGFRASFWFELKRKEPHLTRPRMRFTCWGHGRSLAVPNPSSLEWSQMESNIVQRGLPKCETEDRVQTNCVQRKWPPTRSNTRNLGSEQETHTRTSKKNSLADSLWTGPGRLCAKNQEKQKKKNTA